MAFNKEKKEKEIHPSKQSDKISVMRFLLGERSSKDGLVNGFVCFWEKKPNVFWGRPPFLS